MRIIGVGRLLNNMMLGVLLAAEIIALAFTYIDCDDLS